MAKPTGKHIMVMLGIGGKPDSGGAPPPRPGRSAPPPADDADGPEEPETPGEQEPDEDDVKVSPDKALYHGPDENCGSCTHFTAPNACSKVDAMVDAGGHCWSFYEPKGGGQPMGAGGMPMMPPPPAGGVQ